MENTIKAPIIYKPGDIVRVLNYDSWINCNLYYTVGSTKGGRFLQLFNKKGQYYFVHRKWIMLVKAIEI